MLEYIIKSSLLLAVLYGGFALLLSRETFHRFNRMALLTVLVASMVLPLERLTIQKPEFLDFKEAERGLPESNSQYGRIANPTEETGQTKQMGLTEKIGQSEEAIANPSKDGGFAWGEAIYLLGLLASLAIFFMQLFRLWQEIRSGVHTKDELGNTVVIHGGDFAPFSFLHYIIISASDYEHLRRPILAHEQAHIRLGHTYDLLLFEAVKAVQWFNPFIYLLGRDFKAIHEYEADDAVLSFGIDAKTYQLLLVTKAVGSRLQTVCNNLSHHSLKKRIKMMHTHKSNRWLMGKALILPAFMALAIVAWAKKAPSPNLSPEEERLSRQEISSPEEGALPVEVQVPGLGLVMTDEVQGLSKKKMLNAFIPKDDAKDFIKKHGPAITVFWLKGTWV
ncbi:MAG: M56 family metallopeptidase, partial [Bacteroidaceae bacterium]|nr:M56 family metallopeptidase [Bacteroidaceae bacterium]